MKYLVMECHMAYAVVLGDDGRFLKVANIHYEVGQTVTDVVEMMLPQADAAPKKQTSRRWIPVLTSIMAACLLLVFGGFFMNYMPYASVYMAINPEIRIDVSRTDRVLEISGVNADGLDLLQGYEAGSEDLDLVMDELIDRAIEMGYLHEGGKITLNLDANDKWVTSHETHLNDHLTQYLENKISITIDIVPRKPAQTQPSQSTSDGQSIVIPLEPRSDYGASDYGNETDYGDSGYDTSLDSGFGADGDSGYDDAVDTGSSDSGYGDSVHSSTAQENDSGYDVPDVEVESGYDAPDNDLDSAYEEQRPDEDSDSEYDG